MQRIVHRRRRRRQSHRVPLRHQGLVRAPPDRRQQRDHKQDRRQHEDHPGLLHTAHVHQRNARQNDQTHQQLVLMELRAIFRLLERAHQRRHTRRNTHRRRQHVVDRQRRGRKQPGLVTQVLARHRERPTAVRIRLNRLPIAEIQNRQQRQNQPEDRQQIVLHTPESQWNQQRHRSFGTVRRARQPIQPKDRNPYRWTDLYRMRLIGR